MPYFTQTETGSSAPAPTLAEKTRRRYVELRRYAIARPRSSLQYGGVTWGGETLWNEAGTAWSCLLRARRDATRDKFPKYQPPQIWKGLASSAGFAAMGGGVNNVPAALDSALCVSQVTRPWHPDWALYGKTRAKGQVCQLTAPAELQRRFRADERPFEGTVKHRNLKKVI